MEFVWRLISCAHTVRGPAWRLVLKLAKAAGLMFSVDGVKRNLLSAGFRTLVYRSRIGRDAMARGDSSYGRARCSMRH